MDRQSCRRIAVLAALLAALALSAPAFAIEGHFERTLKVAGPVDLSVSTGAGTITVHTGDAETVRVSGTIKTTNGWHGSDAEAEKRVRYLEANPPIEQHGNIIKIGRIDDPALRRHISISYELVVPVQTQLRSESGSGDQSIDGVRGPLKAETGSGSLSILNIGDEVHASTGSGGIEISSVKGSAHASTGSGPIRATGVAGSFDASTGSGDVRLEQVAAGDVKVSTGSGEVEARGVRGSLHVETGSGSISAEGTPEATWKLDAASGDITVRLPSQAGFDLHASTASGSIHTSREIAVVGTVNPRELRGKVGGGGPLVDLSTASGDIRID